jgi:hypothetical protein
MEFVRERTRKHSVSARNCGYGLRPGFFRARVMSAIFDAIEFSLGHSDVLYIRSVQPPLFSRLEGSRIKLACLSNIKLSFILTAYLKIVSPLGSSLMP